MEAPRDINDRRMGRGEKTKKESETKISEWSKGDRE